MSDTNHNASGNGRLHPPAAPAQTAAAAYAEHLRNVTATLDWLGSELESHAEKQKGDARNWGFVGDLVEVEASVKRALAHLSGMSFERIDRALAGLEA
jgi:hypothetical protein